MYGCVRTGVLVSLYQCFPATSNLHLMTALNSVVHPASGEAVWSSRQSEEGRREGSQASQAGVLGSAAVQEEMAEGEGSRRRQGWARLYHCSGLYSILSHFSAA